MEECKVLPEKPSVLKRCRRFLNRCRQTKIIKEEKIIAVIKLRSKL